MQNENSGGIKNWSQTTVQTGRSTSDRGDSTDAGDDDSEKTTPRTTGGDRTGGCTPRTPRPEAPFSRRPETVGGVAR